MDNFKRLAVLVHARRIEIALIVAVGALIAQLCWPLIMYWWHLPVAGQTGFDTFESPKLAHEYVIQLPLDYFKQPQWPLLVFLHGGGERGTDPSILANKGPFSQQLPAIIAAPQCRQSYDWDPTVLVNFIRSVISRYRVDSDRVYLMGYSMGGYGTWETAAFDPQMFAAIVPISCGSKLSYAKQLRNVPFWAFHGENDTAVALEDCESMVEAVRKAGGNGRLTVLAGQRHGIFPIVCNRPDLWEWLFQQRRP